MRAVQRHDVVYIVTVAGSIIGTMDNRCRGLTLVIARNDEDIAARCRVRLNRNSLRKSLSCQRSGGDVAVRSMASDTVENLSLPWLHK